MTDDMATGKKLTPMMQQYFELKKDFQDVLLLYRMGDFYETFYEDAKTVSKVLGIALTKRGGEDATPLAGFPYHALDAHLPKLLKAGYKVARCEQTEDPKKAKGLVKREVVEVVSPGSTLSEKILDQKQNNYIVSIYSDADNFGLALCDISTGEFLVVETEEKNIADILKTYLPREILSSESKSEAYKLTILNDYSGLISKSEPWFYEYTFSYDLLLKHFKTHSLKGFGCDEMQYAISASGALIQYLKRNYQNELEHITQMEVIHLSDYMTLDSSTKRNLEIAQSIQDADNKGTLISILDKTKTAMGSRLIRKWVINPLINSEQINQRLNLVDSLFENEAFRAELKSILKEIGDLERMLGRVSTGRANARDLIFLKNSLVQIKPLIDSMTSRSDKNWDAIASEFSELEDVIQKIEDAISPDAVHTITDGGIIAKGYNAELDDLRKISSEGKTFIVSLQAKERERTEIPSLKINYNRVFGYYIEITNTHKDKVPESYIRKQTLVNSERYITEELKEYEEKVLGAEDKIKSIEYEIFQDVRLFICKYISEIQKNAKLIAEIDCYFSFAEVAYEFDYVKPIIDDSSIMNVENGRHPVVEQLLPPGENFVRNDSEMDVEKNQILVITGPNMAGKSTYLRQVGLIVLMAQMGSYVPADRAHIGVCDRIFTRVGASDNLAGGESTFLVEMNEAANILNNATQKSLILFDELGRGTSTFDGLSIAWSVVEYLHTNKQRAAKTLFATHYHELTELANLYPRIHNFNIAVEEYGDKIIFLRKIIPGGTDNSYGIQVAKMAGLPDQVIERSKEILINLEQNELNPNTKKSRLAKRQTGMNVDVNQLSMFQAPAAPKKSEVEEALKEITIENLTPLEALNKLNELKKKL